MPNCPWQKNGTMDLCDLSRNPGKALWKEGRSTGPDSVHINPASLGQDEVILLWRICWKPEYNAQSIKQRFGFYQDLPLQVVLHLLDSTVLQHYLSLIMKHAQIFICNRPTVWILSYRSWKWWLPFSHCLLTFFFPSTWEPLLQVPLGSVCVCC